MIAYIERVARDFLAEHLPPGYSSVGVRVDVRHLAPSLVGSRVRVRVGVGTIEGMRVNFAVEAWDESEQIGAGEHQRVVIDEDRFLKRLEQRISAKAGSGENPAAPNG
jgi:predicted thioesterase